MFKDNKALTSLNISSFNTTNVTNMAEMFKGCKTITEIDLSSFNFKDELISGDRLDEVEISLYKFVDEFYNCEKAYASSTNIDLLNSLTDGDPKVIFELKE